jgi:hypothetical protein
VLCGNALLAAALAREFALGFQLFKDVVHGVSFFGVSDKGCIRLL